MIAPDLLTSGFSAREAAKQLILLEDHLAVPAKRCADCIGKHRLAAEAFAEEALTLDGAASLPWLRELPGAIRAATDGRAVRAVRKGLTTHLQERGLLGLGTPMTTVHVRLIAAEMNPNSWAASEPGLKLGLRRVGLDPDGSHVFETGADPTTVEVLLAGDPRVAASFVEGPPPAPPVRIRQPALVGEARPAPGSPGPYQLPGYVPHAAGAPLSWAEKALAELPPGLAAKAREPAGLPWWAVVGLALLALK